MDEHTLNDLLECSVCLERLDTSSKVLPCQHTFCRKCLEVIVSSRQELRCPECRVLVEVKIDDLPPNVLLMRILEGMKNAAAIKTQQQQKSHTCKSSPDIRNVTDYEQQQQHTTIEHTQIQQQQLLPVSNSINGGAQQLPQQFIQQRRCLLPHAYALYDFESSEPSDLHFKKGDLVLLKRKIDSNWYVGQLNNGNGFISEGTFPINHVQVVVPLPTPQCIALYDFKMPPNEEQGCLTFKKGTIIHVLRRVDHNWAEGCIGSSIGIFPIAFVELNALAKQVLEATYLVTNMSTAMTTAPPTIDIAALAANYSASTTSSGKQIMPHQLRNPPPMPQIDTNNSESTTSSASASNSSSSATSPQSVSTTTTTTASNSGMACVGINSGVNSTSMPSSPNQSLPASPQHESSNLNIVSGSSSVRFRDKREKRHSLNALLSAGNLHTGLGTGATLSILQSNRHSAEILSVPTETNSPDIVRHASCDGSGEVQEGINAANVAVPQSTIAREQQQQQQQIHTQQMQQKQQLPPQHTQQRVNVLKTSVVQQHIPPSLPWGYLALYPYKPRKSDELELKKGCVYIVIERCLDGWFKGKNWQDITGVFPGNYVTPLRSRDQQQLMHQWKYVPLQSSPHLNQTTIKPGSNLVPIVQSPPAVTSTTQRIHSLHQPPDLPPRQVSSALPASSVWTKPLGHTVEAFFNRYSKAHDTTKEQNVKEKDSGKQKENMPNTATPTASSSTTSSAVQLMKRLAHIKSRSKSPSSAIARQQQKSPHTQSAHDSSTTTTVDDSSIHNMSKNSVCNAAQKNNTHFASANTHAQLHPVHVRSGSCPSQLLQNLPNDPTALATAPANTSAMAQIQENMHKTQQQKHQQQQQAQMQQIAAQGVGYGSQQLRGPKERPHLQNARQSMDNATLRSIYNSSVPQQQQQQLVSNTPKNAGEQQQQIIPTNIITTNHRKSHSLDAAAALSTSNNDYGAVSGSNSGQTALLAPCNITAAAVAASATTKSTQCSRESRFRCVVPYPPNSEIELELQVGDIIYVQRRQKNGWYKGTHARTNKTGLFPASFVEPDL